MENRESSLVKLEKRVVTYESGVFSRLRSRLFASFPSVQLCKRRSFLETMNWLRRLLLSKSGIEGSEIEIAEEKKDAQVCMPPGWIMLWKWIEIPRQSTG